MGFVGDFFSWKYNRCVHLVLLLLLIVLYIVVIALVLVGDGYITFRFWCSTALAFLFLGLLFLRALRAFDCCFPWFHYITLLFEILAHIVS